jgi:ParB family transcriptional regulator, chromosome partitioning protein
MIEHTRPQHLQMIQIDQIDVMNPRARNKRLHREIVDNINAVGLKRPVTVRARPGDPGHYDLVCGEGRLDAFRLLGQTRIPAVVIEAGDADCMVMSLVENIARRQHRPIDLMTEIGSLHRRGYTDLAIAGKIGCTQSWVNMIVTLLERGEERLVAAVETGLIPISLAVDIARAKNEDVQALLMDAYEAGQIRGKKLGKIRRLLDHRLTQKKSLPDSGFGRRGGSRKLTQTDLMKLYQREADKQRILVRKSDVTQARLIFIVEALRDLLSGGEFPELLRDEGLIDLPRALAGRLMLEAVP